MTYRYPNSRILLFTKSPILGQVKTRMQPVLSAEQSLQLHCLLLESTLDMLERAQIAPLQLWVSAEHDYWQHLRQRFSFECFLQSEGDLGVKMRRAANSALSVSDRVLLIGADCPFLNADYLELALTALNEKNTVVFGPATDGGYVLLGLTAPHDNLFVDIEWGTSQVLQQSIKALNGDTETFSCLSALSDVDRPEDLRLLNSVITTGIMR